jgi:hypothetical protein
MITPQGVTPVRKPSHSQTLTAMLMWFLPIFAAPPLAMQYPDTLEAALILLFIVWMIGVTVITYRIYTQPKGEIRYQVDDIETAKGMYRVWWVMDYLHLPIAMMVIVGAITFAEAYSNIMLRGIFAIIVTLVYGWSIYRIWNRISMFQVLEDSSIWIRRGGRDEAFDPSEFQRVRGVPTRAGRYSSHYVVHRLHFSQHIKGRRPLSLPLGMVRSPTYGTHVYPHVVENFFCKSLEKGGHIIKKHGNGWLATRKIQKNTYRT